MKIIENELGNRISNLFNDFKAEPLASASIAQVHAAQLKNGKDVIIKVVRPGIHKAIKKDLLLMKKIAEFLTSLSDDFKRMHLIEVVNDYELIVYDKIDSPSNMVYATGFKKKTDYIVTERFVKLYVMQYNINVVASQGTRGKLYH